MTIDFPSEIYKLIQKSLTQTLRGNELAVSLKAQFPDFAPGKFSCTNLRDYIRRHVPLVGEVGRAGADIVYGLRGTEQARPTSSFLESSEEVDRVDGRIWKTFVSPSAAYSIYGDPGTGELRVIKSDEPALPSPWVRIPSISADEHLQIAKEFIASLPEPNLFLSQSLSQPRWWLHFHSNAATAGCGDQWVRFRHRKLKQKLQDNLQSQNIPFRRERPTQSRQFREHVTRRQSIDGETLLRKLAIAAIQRMPADELRLLRIPLGYIVDEIQD